MKKNVLICIVFVFLFLQVIGQENNKADICKVWVVYPLIYNDSCKSLPITHWSDYWPDRSISKRIYIPDILSIEISMLRSIYFVDDYNYNSDSIICLSSLFYYVYGDSDDSYLLLNPKKSDTIVIYNSDINLKQIDSQIANSLSTGLSLDTIQILFKQMLLLNNIYVHGKSIDEYKGKIQYLNQLVIDNYMYNKQHELLCNWRFILPINGGYGINY